MTLPKTASYLAASSCPPDIRAELLAVSAGWRDAMDTPTDEEIVTMLATKLMGYKIAWDVFPNNRNYQSPRPVRFASYEEAEAYQESHSQANRGRDFGTTVWGNLRGYIKPKIAMVFPDRRGPRWNPLIREADCAELLEVLNAGPTKAVDVSGKFFGGEWQCAVHWSTDIDDMCVVWNPDRKRAIVLAAYTALLHSTGAGDRSEDHGC